MKKTVFLGASLLSFIVRGQDASNQTVKPGYVPPYTDEDHLNDDDLNDGDNDDDAVLDIKTRPHFCNVLALSDSHNLGPYQAGVMIELIN